MDKIDLKKDLKSLYQRPAKDVLEGRGSEEPTRRARVASRQLSQLASLFTHAILGWAVCGATIAVGREFFPMKQTLLLHAFVAPAAFALLSWDHLRRHPDADPLRAAFGMLGVVIGLDALVVAPFIEESYAMFRSVLGTWLPFAAILAASYFAGRIAARDPTT
jgi:hypothetical protein